MTDFSARFSSNLETPTLARRQLDRWLPAWLGEGDRGALRLLVSELVTNCVRHAKVSADAPVELAMRVAGRTIRIEVHDGGTGFTPPGHPKPRGADGGYGPLPRRAAGEPLGRGHAGRHARLVRARRRPGRGVKGGRRAPASVGPGSARRRGRPRGDRRRERRRLPRPQPLPPARARGRGARRCPERRARGRRGGGPGRHEPRLGAGARRRLPPPARHGDRRLGHRRVGGERAAGGGARAPSDARARRRGADHGRRGGHRRCAGAARRPARPELADAAWIDVRAPGGELRRLAVRFDGPDADELERWLAGRPRHVARDARAGPARAGRRGLPAQRARRRPYRGDRVRPRGPAAPAAVGAAHGRGRAAGHGRAPARRAHLGRRAVRAAVRRGGARLRRAAGGPRRAGPAQRPAARPPERGAGAARRHPGRAGRGGHRPRRRRQGGLRESRGGRAPRREGRGRHPRRRAGRAHAAVRGDRSRRPPVAARAPAGPPRHRRRDAGARAHANRRPRDRRGALVPDQGHAPARRGERRTLAVNIVEDVTEEHEAALRQRFSRRRARRSPPRSTTRRRCAESPGWPCRGSRTGARSSCPTSAAS